MNAKVLFYKTRGKSNIKYLENREGEFSCHADFKEIAKRKKQKCMSVFIEKT